MNKDIARAQCGTLIEWAQLHEQDGVSGCEEAAFLLRRAARLIAGSAEITLSLAAEPRAKEPPVSEVREG